MDTSQYWNSTNNYQHRKLLAEHSIPLGKISKCTIIPIISLVYEIIGINWVYAIFFDEYSSVFSKILDFIMGFAILSHTFETNSIFSGEMCGNKFWKSKAFYSRKFPIINLYQWTTSFTHKLSNSYWLPNTSDFLYSMAPAHRISEMLIYIIQTYKFTSKFSTKNSHQLIDTLLPTSLLSL